MKRLTVLGLLTLLLFGCDYIRDDTFINNESSYDLFYKIRMEDGYEVGGKRIWDVMGTLKKGEYKSLANASYSRNVVGPFKSVSLRISVKNYSYELNVPLESDNKFNFIRNSPFTDIGIQYIEDFVSASDTGGGWFNGFEFSAVGSPMTAENFYGYNAPYYSIEDFYVILDDVIYLADISERKLVKVE